MIEFILIVATISSLMFTYNVVTTPKYEPSAKVFTHAQDIAYITGVDSCLALEEETERIECLGKLDDDVLLWRLGGDSLHTNLSDN